MTARPVVLHLSLEEAEALLQGLWPTRALDARQRLRIAWNDAACAADPDPWMSAPPTAEEERLVQEAVANPDDVVPWPSPECCPTCGTVLGDAD